jgi:hypothetical protein
MRLRLRPAIEVSLKVDRDNARFEIPVDDPNTVLISTVFDFIFITVAQTFIDRIERLVLVLPSGRRLGYDESKRSFLVNFFSARDDVMELEYKWFTQRRRRRKRERTNQTLSKVSEHEVLPFGVSRSKYLKIRNQILT